MALNIQQSRGKCAQLSCMPGAKVTNPHLQRIGPPCRCNRYERRYLTPLVCDRLHIIDVECLIAATTTHTHTGGIVGLVQCRLCSSIDHVACTVSAAARSFAHVVPGLKRSGRGLVSAASDVAWSQLQCVRELTWYLLLIGCTDCDLN
jgi:hypothetical protein